MKEFSAQTGGRHTYVDDIINLQDLALAFASIFSGCDNFIISGCETSGASISPGYVYINGKIRNFAGVSGIKSWPQFIYESNRIETVAYASGTDKVGRNIYGCSVAQSVPTALDPLTGIVPAFIKITATGGVSTKDALFGKYSLLLQASTGSQSIEGMVNFINDVQIGGSLMLNGKTTIKQGNAIGSVYYEGNDFIVSSCVASGATYRLVIKNGLGFHLYVNEKLVCESNENRFFIGSPISTKECVVGNIAIEDNGITNKGYASNAASVNINVTGYAGGTGYFRNTYIGNGRGTVVMSVLGNTGAVQINGQLSLKTSSNIGLLLSSTLPKNNTSLRKTIEWQDTNDVQIAYMGYNKVTSNVFEINNSLSSISIYGLAAVDIGPAIKENGALLSEKYVTSVKLGPILESKANADSVYTSDASDAKYATKAGGLTQFSGHYTKAQLRQHIEAVGSADIDGKYPQINSLLEDMATTESKKAQICKNIGAAREGDFQDKLYDSGWIGVGGSLYARQIGSVVCIQGRTTTLHGGTVFTLPNSIDAPRYDTIFSTAIANNANWSCKIPGGGKSCGVIYCNCHGNTISFSMTYMI